MSDETPTLFDVTGRARHLRDVTYTDGDDTVTVYAEPDSGPCEVPPRVVTALCDAADADDVTVECISRYAIRDGE